MPQNTTAPAESPGEAAERIVKCAASPLLCEQGRAYREIRDLIVGVRSLQADKREIEAELGRRDGTIRLLADTLDVQTDQVRELARELRGATAAGKSAEDVAETNDRVVRRAREEMRLAGIRGDQRARQRAAVMDAALDDAGDCQVARRPAPEAVVIILANGDVAKCPTAWAGRRSAEIYDLQNLRVRYGLPPVRVLDYRLASDPSDPVSRAAYAEYVRKSWADPASIVDAAEKAARPDALQADMAAALASNLDVEVAHAALALNDRHAVYPDDLLINGRPAAEADGPFNIGRTCERDRLVPRDAAAAEAAE